MGEARFGDLNGNIRSKIVCTASGNARHRRRQRVDQERDAGTFSSQGSAEPRLLDDPNPEDNCDRDERRHRDHRGVLARMRLKHRERWSERDAGRAYRGQGYVAH